MELSLRTTRKHSFMETEQTPIPSYKSLLEPEESRSSALEISRRAHQYLNNLKQPKYPIFQYHKHSENIMDIIRKFSIGSKNDDPEEEIAKLHRKLSTNTRRISDVSRKYQRVQEKQEELERKLVAAKQRKAEDDAFYAKQAKAVKRPEKEHLVWWQIPATSFSEMAGIIPDRGEEGEVMVRRAPTSGSDNPLLSASRSRSNSRSRRPPSTTSHRSSITEVAEGAARTVKNPMTDGHSLNKRGRPPAAGARYGHLFDNTIEPSTMTGATPLVPPQRQATSVGDEHCQQCGR